VACIYKPAESRATCKKVVKRRTAPLRRPVPPCAASKTAKLSTQLNRRQVPMRQTWNQWGRGGRLPPWGGVPFFSVDGMRITPSRGAVKFGTPSSESAPFVKVRQPLSICRLWVRSLRSRKRITCLIKRGNHTGHPAPFAPAIQDGTFLTIYRKSKPRSR
jgi:hypothetical protein